ncbi:MAG: hypothetical protein AABY07_05335 [Nanoarchaeota archaeon]
MSEVKIVNGEKKDVLKSLTKFLTIALGILTGVVIIISYDNPGITGYTVFSGVYGVASPFVLIFLLLVIIYMYVKLHKE